MCLKSAYLCSLKSPIKLSHIVLCDLSFFSIIIQVNFYDNVVDFCQLSHKITLHHDYCSNHTLQNNKCTITEQLHVVYSLADKNLCNSHKN